MPDLVAYDARPLVQRRYELCAPAALVRTLRYHRLRLCQRHTPESASLRNQHTVSPNEGCDWLENTVRSSGSGRVQPPVCLHVVRHETLVTRHGPRVLFCFFNVE
jgi:hypothetical protein